MKESKGIGGWLLIPTFSFIVTAIIFIYLSGLFMIDLYIEYDDMTYLIFCMFAFLSCFHVYTLILEFKKKKSFKKCAIALLWMGYVSALIMEFTVDGTSTYFYSGIIVGSLWTWYFIKSKRVKNTFVN